MSKKMSNEFENELANLQIIYSKLNDEEKIEAETALAKAFEDVFAKVCAMSEIKIPIAEAVGLLKVIGSITNRVREEDL